MTLATITGVNVNTAAFLASHMASARQLGLEAQGGLNAIQELVAGGNSCLPFQAVTRGDGFEGASLSLSAPVAGQDTCAAITRL